MISINRWIPWKKKGSSAQITPNTAERAEKAVESVRVDRPILTQDEDLLGRSRAAEGFAHQVIALDASEGLVVGILGPWGSGKTSFINLACAELERQGSLVLHFNPWMFSGADQLVEAFFVELTSQLKVRAGLTDVAEKIEDYGEVFSGMSWLPLLGPWIERGRVTTEVLSTLLKRRKSGIGDRREKVENALRSLRRPLVLVIDDIDRLSTAEIRDIFKLVRLTASFPNLIYILALDRHRTENALRESGVPGREYLEKILQLAVDLPAVPGEVLDRQIFAALNETLARVPVSGKFDESVWADVFPEIVRPCIRHMRDVRRYAAGVHGTVCALNGEIALADVLALEAVRIFMPDVFPLLPGALDALTETDPDGSGRSERNELKAHVTSLLQAAGSQDKIVRALIERVFPAAQRHIGGSSYGSDWEAGWLRHRRAAHRDILRLYLERVMGQDLQTYKEAEVAWTHMADPTQFEQFLRSVDPERVQDVISRLEIFENHFDPDTAPQIAAILLKLLSEIPQRPRGFFDLDTRRVVSRVVYRLLRSLRTTDAVEAGVRKILPELNSLSERLDLIEMVGYREHRGHKMISEQAASELQAEWRSQVRAASVADLRGEMDILQILLTMRRDSTDSEPVFEIPDDPVITIAALKNARSEILSNTMGDRFVRRTGRLSWKALTEAFGGEDMLRERVEASRTLLAEEGDLLELTEAYLAGRRDEDFGDDD